MPVDKLSVFDSTFDFIKNSIVSTKGIVEINQFSKSEDTVVLIQKIEI